MQRTRVLLIAFLAVLTMETHQNMSYTVSNTCNTNTWNMRRTRILLTAFLAVLTMETHPEHEQYCQ